MRSSCSRQRAEGVTLSSRAAALGVATPFRAIRGEGAQPDVGSLIPTHEHPKSEKQGKGGDLSLSDGNTTGNLISDFWQWRNRRSVGESSVKRKRSRGRGSEAATTGFFVVDSRRGGSWQWARVREGVGRA